MVLEIDHQQISEIKSSMLPDVRKSILYENKETFTVTLVDDDGYSTDKYMTIEKGQLYFIDDNWLSIDHEIALRNLLDGSFLGVGLDTLETNFIKHEVEIRV